MPTTIAVAAFVLGSVLALIALLGGRFKIFGAEIPSRVSQSQRIVAGCLAVIFFGAAISTFQYSTSDALSRSVDEGSTGDDEPDQPDPAPPDEQAPPDREVPPPPIKEDPPQQDHPDSTPQVEQAAEVRETSGFEISFFGCKLAGSETVCSFNVLNTMQDRSLQISGSGIRNGAGVMISSYSRLVGTDGVEYRASWVEAASRRENVRLDHLFYSGVTTPTKVAFAGLPPDLSMAARLVVHFGSSELQFRNVGIE